MNTLEQYIKDLELGDYDARNVNAINSGFQQVIKQLLEEGQADIANEADLNRQVFSVQKSFDTKLDNEKGTINGLSWQMNGTQTLEDGSQIPLYWPDVTKLTPQDFENFEKRYKRSENLFVKTEYGLMVYFGGKTAYSKHNDFKKELTNCLFQLSQDYFNKAEKGGDKNHYVLDFFRTLRMAFGIAERANIEPALSEIIQYMFQTHQNWDITRYGTLRILLDLSGLMSDYFGLFKNRIDFQSVLEKNLEGAKELEKTYLWGAMYAIDRNIVIEQKRNKSTDALLEHKASLYEKLTTEAKSKSNFACVSFAENALRIYQQLKDNANTDRLEKIYNELRGEYRLSEFKQEFPEGYVDQMNERILQTVAENDENGIIYHFIASPWYDSVKNIKDRSIELSKETVFLSMLATSILDKFGNTVDVFHTEDEKEKFSFWKSYTHNYQIGTATMHSFFIEAYKAGKLNYGSVLSYLENTWFNDVITRKYHGQTVEVKPLDTLKPGLKKIFEELGNYLNDSKYQCDFVTVTDSLTLKVEGLLRYFCEKTGIATFKTRQKGSDKLVMEKILDELLADIAHEPPLKPDQKTNFDENDRIFIKYVMTEKAGLNLRNAVAHSLMDIYEYSFEHVIVLFCIIMKLSKYEFVEKKGENSNDNGSK